MRIDKHLSSAVVPDCGNLCLLKPHNICEGEGNFSPSFAVRSGKVHF